ncbi:hypothetical protein Tco_0622552 [Tanacetum coccineum]
MDNNLKMGYNSVMPRKRWSNLDKKRSRIMVKDVESSVCRKEGCDELGKVVGGREPGKTFDFFTDNMTKQEKSKLKLLEFAIVKWLLNLQCNYGKDQNESLRRRGFRSFTVKFPMAKGVATMRTNREAIWKCRQIDRMHSRGRRRVVKSKGVTTRGGKVASTVAYRKETHDTNLNKREPPRVQLIEPNKPEETTVNKEPPTDLEQNTQAPTKPQERAIPFPN